MHIQPEEVQDKAAYKKRGSLQHFDLQSLRLANQQTFLPDEEFEGQNFALLSLLNL